MHPEFDSKLYICPLCNSKHISLFDYDFKGIEIYHCSECATKFMNPPYSQTYLDALYDGYTNKSEIQDTDSSLQAANLECHQFHFRKIEKYIAPGKALLFGCGNGSEIRTAIARNWNVNGYDIDRSCIDHLKQKYKFDFYTGNFFELNLPSSEYDCIYLDQVLEHLKNPQDYLNEFQRILKPGGILFIASPNIKSFSSQFKIIFGKLGLKQQRGRHYDTWHHMFYYNPTALSKLLENKFEFECQLKGNDVFVLPESSSFRKGFIRIMTILPIIWRSTFYLIAKKK